MGYGLRYIICSALTVGGTARLAAQPASPRLKTEYLDSARTVLPSAHGAVYRRETEQQDSVRGIVRDFYLDGRRESVSEVEFRKGVPLPNGTAESWHPNGQLSHHQEYAHGQRVGEMRLYYPSGQLKRRARYLNNLESVGECFAENGQSVPFFEYEIMPVYSGGDGSNAALVYFIQRSVRYPKDALKANKSGRVFVRFNVSKTGEVADIKVVKGVFPSLDAEVVRAVQQLKRFTPGQQDGRAVAVAYTLPITFAIQ